MEMAKTATPKIIKLFVNLLWADSPIEWTIKSTYYRKTLFISVSIKESNQKVCRSFLLVDINKRSKDLWGMANDCISEIKSETESH